jgi:hypothetical protein
VCNQAYPELFSYARAQHISLNVAASTAPLQNLFHLPLSNEAYVQFHELSVILHNLQLSQANDVWSYIWGSSNFSSSKAYKHLIGQRHMHRSYKWLWTSAWQNKQKCFFWLVPKDTLSTRALLRRRGMHLPDYSCVFFHSECSSRSASSHSLNIILPNTNDISLILESIRDQLRSPFFMEITVIMW